MEYLNRECLLGVSPEQFQNQYPYPWINIPNSLTPEGYWLLRANLPPVDAFDLQVGRPQPDGQASHDRYLLHFRPGVQVAEPWLEFIAELRGSVYQAFLRQMLGNHRFIPTFDWYYAWDGCGVSPQCDAARKRATHVFYFNTDEDWKPEWGGQILILDSARRFSLSSCPGFEDLTVAASIEPLGNGSLLFQRTPHSWHGVRPLECPRGVLRRLFLVTVNIPTFQVRWRGIRGKDPDGFSLKAA